MSYDTDIREHIFAKYHFSRAELDEIADRLAERINYHNEVEAEMKAAAKQYKSDLSQIENEIQSLAAKRKDGYESRSFLCDVRLDPIMRERVYIDAETGVEVKRTPFRQGDQLWLHEQMDAEAEAAEEAAAEAADEAAEAEAADENPFDQALAEAAPEEAETEAETEDPIDQIFS